MSISSKINTYFDQKGINVSYNTLNATELLVRSYVKDFRSVVNTFGNKKSEYIKHYCYNKIYNIAPRNKFTGFENIRKKDKQFRAYANTLITDSTWPVNLVVDTKDHHDITINYKEALKQHVRTLNNSLLYLSGGLDSELLANAMLDADVKFTPVIWEYTNNKSEIINHHDIALAYEFCKNRGLIPLIKSVNLEELWDSREFLNLAIDTQISSPQILTHCYMINEMARVYSDKTHVFGGEVRFSTYHTLDDGTPASLVFLNKVPASGLGYNNVTYSWGSMDGGGPYGLGFLVVVDTSAPGAISYYRVTKYINYTEIDIIEEGNLATASTIPGYTTVYQGRILSAQTIQEYQGSGGQLIVVNPPPPPSGTYPTPWESLNQGATFITQLHVSGGLGTGLGTNATYSWTFQLRTQADPTNIVESTLIFNCYAGGAST